jgi:trigger factor
MEIQVQEIEKCKLKVHYEADSTEIQAKRAEVLNTFKKAPVKGFRDGKAPLEAINMHYRTQIDEATKRALAETAYHETIFEKKLRAHGTPQFKSLKMESGKFSCEFEMLTKPDFEVADFKNMEVPKPADPMSSEEMAEKMLQELRVKFGDVTPFSNDDFVQTGDNLLIDFEGSVDGEKVDSLCATGEMLTVGKNQVVGFDDNLLGMKTDEEREFDIVVPAGGLPSIAGKTVHFKVKLVTGAKSTPCPLNDELAQHMGKSTFEELRALVASTASARTANSAKAAINEAVANRLVADNTVDVPNWMSLSEAQYLAQKSKMDWATMSDEDKVRFLDIAEKNVKLSLILDKIREDEPEAQLSDQEVFEVIKQNLAQTQVQQPMDEIIKQMQDSGYLQILFARIRDEFAMDFVTKTIKIID